MALKAYHYSNDAFFIPEVLSKIECQGLIKDAETRGFETAGLNSSRPEDAILSIRNNARVIYDCEALANTLWERVKESIPPFIDGWRAIELNERIRIYRYENGQEFKLHRDGLYQRSLNQESRLTFMIYLNQEFVGGGTNFDDFDVVPQTGMCLCFRHYLPHAGAPVQIGRKYALRSDVMYEAPESCPS